MDVPMLCAGVDSGEALDGGAAGGTSAGVVLMDWVVLAVRFELADIGLKVM